MVLSIEDPLYRRYLEEELRDVLCVELDRLAEVVAEDPSIWLLLQSDSAEAEMLEIAAARRTRPPWSPRP
jgi:hypothetical protein